MAGDTPKKAKRKRPKPAAANCNCDVPPCPADGSWTLKCVAGTVDWFNDAGLAAGKAKKTRKRP